VDATGLMVRCQRAAQHRALTTAAGVPTGALLMFITSLARLTRQHDPEWLAVCWDGPGALEWRRQRYPAYKSGRAPAPVLTPHRETLMDRTVAFCRAAGVPQFCVDGFEADDLMAALARRAHPACCLTGRRVIIASDDADMEQLTAFATVRLAGLSRDGLEDAADVESRTGVPPIMLPKLRALAGDPSDSIPGLRGTGPVKAARMLRSAGWMWRDVLNGITDPQHREMAVLWRDIIDLVIPSRPPEEVTGRNYFQPDVSCVWAGEPTEHLAGFLREYELTSVLRRVERGGFWRSRS
jgi:DNA polymerase-1